MSKSTLTKKQIIAKLISIKFAIEDGGLDYDLLHGGYTESDAEDTELAPFVKEAKTSLKNLLDKVDIMFEQYDIENIYDMEDISDDEPLDVDNNDQ